MLTGYTDEETALQAMRDGAINYLRKPLDIEQLFVAIQTLRVKVLFKRDLLSKMRMQLESGRERAARDNRYIAVF